MCQNTWRNAATMRTTCGNTQKAAVVLVTTTHSASAFRQALAASLKPWRIDARIAKNQNQRRSIRTSCTKRASSSIWSRRPTVCCTSRSSRTSRQSTRAAALSPSTPHNKLLMDKVILATCTIREWRLRTITKETCAYGWMLDFISSKKQQRFWPTSPSSSKIRAWSFISKLRSSAWDKISAILS